MSSPYIYNYYYVPNIIGLLKKYIHVDNINKDAVEHAFDRLKVPFIRSEKGYRLYRKWIIRDLLNVPDNLEKILYFIEEFNSPEGIVAKDRYIKKRNKEDMLKYLDSIIDEPKSSSMEDASNDLLRHDDVYYDVEMDEEEQLSDVEGEWKPKEGLFTEKDPKKIANYLIRHSKDKGQAMKRLVFYMNRAGENLTNKTVLNKVKKILQESKNITINDKIKLIKESSSYKLTINDKIKLFEKLDKD